MEMKLLQKIERRFCTLIQMRIRVMYVQNATKIRKQTRYHILLYIKEKWQQRWVNYRNNKGCKLYEIMPEFKLFYMSNLSRKVEVVIHRIRTGHTRLTHKYLMENRFKRVPQCDYCRLDTLSVKHLMIECPHFAGIRKNHYRVAEKYLFERIPLPASLFLQ